jgi:ABC-type transport system substrate-binding protein
MALQTWKANYPDPAKQTFFFFSPRTFGLWGNWSYWKNDRCEELCDVVLTELDKNKRARATLEIQKLDVERFVIPLP